MPDFNTNLTFRGTPLLLCSAGFRESRQHRVLPQSNGASRARVFPTIGVVFILQSFTASSFSLFFKTLRVKDCFNKHPSPALLIIRKKLPFDGVGEGGEGKKHECRVMCARMYARERSKQKGEVVWRSSEVVFSTSDVNATTSEVDAHTFDRKEIHSHRQAKRGKTFYFLVRTGAK